MSIDLLDIKNEAKVTVIEEEAAKKDKNDSKTNTTCERTDDLKPEDTGEEDNITVNNSEVMAGKYLSLSSAGHSSMTIMESQKDGDESLVENTEEDKIRCFSVRLEFGLQGFEFKVRNETLRLGW